MDSVTLFCPHCCNTASQTKLHSQSYTSEGYTVPTGEKEYIDSISTVVRCETCKQILIYDKLAGYMEEDTIYGSLVYPELVTSSPSIPLRVKTVYNDALRVKNISPDAFVILARKTLEEICKEKGVIEKDLEMSLKKLVSTGEIPKNLVEACNIVRLVGNTGAHAADIRINMLHVWAIDSFIKVILEYMYVAPTKVAEFKEKYKDFIK